MKIFGKLENAIVLTLKREQGSGDYAGSYFHRIGLFFPDTQEMGELNCSEEIYKACQSVVGDPNKKVNFDFVYNTEYKKLSLIGASASKSKA